MRWFLGAVMLLATLALAGPGTVDKQHQSFDSTCTNYCVLIDVLQPADNPQPLLRAAESPQPSEPFVPLGVAVLAENRSAVLLTAVSVPDPRLDYRVGRYLKHESATGRRGLEPATVYLL